MYCDGRGGLAGDLMWEVYSYFHSFDISNVFRFPFFPSRFVISTVLFLDAGNAK